MHARDVVDATLAPHLVASDAVVAVPGALDAREAKARVHAVHVVQIVPAVLVVVMVDAHHAVAAVMDAQMVADQSVLAHVMEFAQPRICLTVKVL